MDGDELSGITFTCNGLELNDIQPLASVVVAEYCPVENTSMSPPVAPLLQVILVAGTACNSTEPPSQNVKVPTAEITGGAGNGHTVTLNGADTALGQPLKSITLTVKVPLEFTD